MDADVGAHEMAPVFMFRDLQHAPAIAHAVSRAQHEAAVQTPHRAPIDLGRNAMNNSECAFNGPQRLSRSVYRPKT
jgi:hypothetical protein